MLVLAIALILIGAFSPVTVPTFVVWLMGMGALGFWMGRSIAEPVKKEDSDER